MPLRDRQQGIQCDSCENWQHRTYDTGITQQQYKLAVRGNIELDWRCENYSWANMIPVAESTQLETMDISDLKET